MEIFPNYYKKFKCIADKCNHSCCIGWEIAIDDDTMQIYNSIDDEFGIKIRNSIDENNCFILNNDGSCPFLNKNGLCEIILKYGEDAISDICYLHPRFSNFYSEFTETGLGLSCEEAARIILTDNEKFYIPLPDHFTEKDYFKKRQHVFDILQDRKYTMLERFEKLSKETSISLNFSSNELFNLYNSLERLDDKWNDYLKILTDNSINNEIFTKKEYQIFFEQLSCYFVFRHFHNGVGFALLSCYVIGAICSNMNCLEKMLDVVRMYSAEVEYSDINIEKINEYINKKTF